MRLGLINQFDPATCRGGGGGCGEREGSGGGGGGRKEERKQKANDLLWGCHFILLSFAFRLVGFDSPTSFSRAQIHYFLLGPLNTIETSSQGRV